MCAPHVHRRFSSAVARGPTPLRAHMRMPTCASLPAQGVFDVTLWCEHEGVAFELLHAVKVLTVEAAVATHIPSAIQNAPSVHGRSLKAGTRLRLPLLLLDRYGNGTVGLDAVDISLSGPDASGAVTPLTAYSLLTADGVLPSAPPTPAAASARSPRSPTVHPPSPRSPDRQGGRSPSRRVSASATTCAVSTADPMAAHRTPVGGGRASGGQAAGATAAASPSRGTASSAPTARPLATPGVDLAAEMGALCTHATDHPLTRRGVYSLSVRVGGKPLRGSPLEFHVVPGAPSGSRSSLRPPPLPVFTHRPFELLVQACDRWSNRLETGGATVAARTNGPGAVQCTVADNMDGTYTIALIASCSGDYRVIVSLDGHQVIGPPHAWPLHRPLDSTRLNSTRLDSTRLALPDLDLTAH